MTRIQSPGIIAQAPKTSHASPEGAQKVLGLVPNVFRYLATGPQSRDTNTALQTSLPSILMYRTARFDAIGAIFAALAAPIKRQLKTG